MMKFDARRGTTQSGNAEQLGSLMARYAAGDDTAFASLHRRLSPQLHRYLVRLCGDATLAEDVLQITFQKLHRFRGQYRAGSSVGAWVKVIARRSLWDERRGLAARHEFIGGGELPEHPATDVNLDGALDLRGALAQLPEHYRSAVQLTKLLGFSGEEAAEISSTTRTALKVRVHRGLGLMRGLLMEGATAAA